MIIVLIILGIILDVLAMIYLPPPAECDPEWIKRQLEMERAKYGIYSSKER